MKYWSNEQELLEMMRTELNSAVIGDILDQIGLVHQFLPPQVRPLQDSMVLAGRAMPVLEADCVAAGKNNAEMSRPFGLMLDALDDLKENEVYLCSGASPDYALVGELMMTRAKHLNAAGAVVNGYSRDTAGILALDFPVFSYGGYAQDQAPRGKVVDFRVPVEIDGVLVRPGDLVFGDWEGVVIIPKEWEGEVLKKAYEKVHGEKLVAQALRSGMSAGAAFQKFGIM